MGYASAEGRRNFARAAEPQEQIENRVALRCPPLAPPKGRGTKELAPPKGRGTKERMRNEKTEMENRFAPVGKFLTRQ